jgi:thioredoxin reductase
MTYDTVIVGAGPAGLSAALNLVRACRTVLLIDSNRPRNAPTLASHGFITRDGISPLELRRLGRDEIATYDNAEIHSGLVRAVKQTNNGFRITTCGQQGDSDRVDEATTLIIASGLSETLPVVQNLRAYYGTQLHSCIECDAYEKRDEPLAFIGETDDLAERALFLSHWNTDLIVFTNNIGTITKAEEEQLTSRNIQVDRRPIAEIAGKKGVMTGITFTDGKTVTRSGGFIRPVWKPTIDYLAEELTACIRQGLICVDSDGRTPISSLYAIGDCTAQGPRQLIIAAGDGARVAAAINHDLFQNELA